MLNFFKRKKQTALVFIDFEHWCISLDKQYRLRPKIKEFYEQLDERFDVKRMMFFGDFSNLTLKNEINSVRDVPNDLIDTQNPSKNLVKDFTDFIMLDYIYQMADEFPKVNNYIIFTGDGHFSSVARYLKFKRKKQVIIYGIRNSISAQLRSIADECHELPETSDEHERYYQYIIDNFDYLEKRKSTKPVYPTFNSTIKNIADYYKIEQESVQIALQELMERGIITKREIKPVSYGNSIRILSVEWDKAIAAGLWKSERA